MSETTIFPIPNAYNHGFAVLIFSSDKSFVDHHRTILLSIGFVSITVAELEEALAILRLTAIDLVIVDRDAGVQETVQVLERARDGWCSIPVLVVSQVFDAELQRLAMELGAAGYLDHPAFQDDVVRALLPNRSRTGTSMWGPQQN
jgi:DNA-binding response OmpR family regulator